jgi:hypothetical protein
MQPTAGHSVHTYEIRPRKDGRGFDLISDALPSGHLWYLEVRQAIDYAKHQSRAHDAGIRVYDEAGNVIETPEQRPAHLVRARLRTADICLASSLSFVFVERFNRLPRASMKDAYQNGFDSPHPLFSFFPRKTHFLKPL